MWYWKRLLCRLRGHQDLRFVAIAPHPNKFWFSDVKGRDTTASVWECPRCRVAFARYWEQGIPGMHLIEETIRRYPLEI